MKRRPDGRAHQAVGPQAAVRQGPRRRGKELCGPRRRTPTSSGTCSGPTRSRRASWRRSSGRGTPRRDALADELRCRRQRRMRGSSSGAAGQPSDLEQQGGHAGGVGDLGKAWLCAAQHVAIVVVFFLAVAREGQWPAVNLQRSKIRRGEGEDEVAWWDPRVRKVNRETAGVNCVLGMKTFLLHPQ
jgi:hypothetical protein